MRNISVVNSWIYWINSQRINFFTSQCQSSVWVDSPKKKMYKNSNKWRSSCYSILPVGTSVNLSRSKMSNRHSATPTQWVLFRAFSNHCNYMRITKCAFLMHLEILETHYLLFEFLCKLLRAAVSYLSFELAIQGCWWMKNI